MSAPGRSKALPLSVRIVLPFATFTALLAGTAVLDLTQASWRWAFPVLIAIATLPTVLLWLLTTRFIRGVLARQRAALDKVGIDLDAQLRPTGPSEVAQVAVAFNGMVQRLRADREAAGKTAVRVEDTFFTMMEVMAGAIEARDPYRRGRSKRVTEYALLIARHLDLTPEARGTLRKAGILHDIGTITLDEELVRKQGGLDAAQETALMRHPDAGVSMLRGIAFMEEALPVIRHHHERYDGSGYPLALKGEDIPVGARVLAVADALDAMTSERPYRAAQGFDFAKNEILNSSGTHFDPEVVTAFIKCQAQLRVMVEMQHAQVVADGRAPSESAA